MPYKVSEDLEYRESDYYRAASRYKNKACSMTFDGEKKSLFDYSKFKEYKSIDDFLDEYKESGLVKSPDGKVNYAVVSTVSKTLEAVCRKCPHGTFDFRSDEPCEFERDFSKAFEVCLTLDTNVICERCGYAFDCSGQHNVKMPAIHDVRLNGRVSKLIVKRIHPVCPRCGRRVHAKPIEGIQENVGSRLSKRLCKEITKLSIQTYGPGFTAQGYGLTRDTVQTRMREVLRRAREEKQHQEGYRLYKSSGSYSAEEHTTSYLHVSFATEEKQYLLYCSYRDWDKRVGRKVYLCDIFGDEGLVVEKWMSGDYSVRMDESVSPAQKLLIVYYHTGCMYPPALHKLAYLIALLIDSYTQYLFFSGDAHDKKEIGMNIDCCLAELQIPPCSVAFFKTCVLDIIKKAKQNPVGNNFTKVDYRREMVCNAAQEVLAYLNAIPSETLGLSGPQRDEIAAQSAKQEAELFVEELKVAMETVKGSKEFALWCLLYGNPAAMQVPRDMQAGQAAFPITENGYYDVNFIRSEVPLACLKYMLQSAFLDGARNEPIPCAKIRYFKSDSTEENKLPCGGVN